MRADKVTPANGRTNLVRPSFNGVHLTEYAFDDVGFFDAGQFDVQSAELKREALMVDAHAMQDGRMEVA